MKRLFGASECLPLIDRYLKGKQIPEMVTSVEWVITIVILLHHSSLNFLLNIIAAEWFVITEEMTIVKLPDYATTYEGVFPIYLSFT